MTVTYLITSLTKHTKSCGLPLCYSDLPHLPTGYGAINARSSDTVLLLSTCYWALPRPWPTEAGTECLVCAYLTHVT